MRLSDNSLAYNVEFCTDANGIGTSLPAVTYDDAIALADKLADAIEAHSNDTADVIIVWDEEAA